MIIEKETKRSTFLDYMLYQEKDDAPRRNMKVINVKVSDKRRQDYTKGAELEDEEEIEEPITDNEDYTNEPETGEETDAGADEPVTDGEDYTGGAETDDAGEETVDTVPEENETPPEGETETVDVATGEETGGETDAEGAGADEPVTDDEDYTGGAETDDAGEGMDGEANAGAEEPAEGENTETDGNADENSVEQLYKYNLYKKFQKVLKTIEDYSDELENITSDDIEINTKYKQLTTKLKDIEDLMKDYMIMKFSKVSFMQSMLFYQRVVTSVDIILQTLKYVREKELKSKM